LFAVVLAMSMSDRTCFFVVCSPSSAPAARALYGLKCVRCRCVVVRFAAGLLSQVSVSVSSFVNCAAGQDGGGAAFFGPYNLDVSQTSFSGCVAGRHAGSVYLQQSPGYPARLQDVVVQCWYPRFMVCMGTASSSDVQHPLLWLVGALMPIPLQQARR
jgi:hypothetical protein